jgi:hypothetical protein
MARKTIDIGVIGNDGTGDSIRDSFRKVNDNFRELYGALGISDGISFVDLGDTPDSYSGQYDPITNNTPLVTINDTQSGLAFKRLVAGNGISLNFTRDIDPEGPNQIIINSDFAAISSDPNPSLGGNLRARTGGVQHRIIDLGTNTAPLAPIFNHEAVNKSYADSKVSLRGVDSINPSTGLPDGSFGRMGGPLILSRNPEAEDDELYGGLIAATKSYVDNAAFGSVANLWVATSGQDVRPGVSKELQGRALAYAYRTIEAACKRAEELVLASPIEIGPYKKTLTYNNGAESCTLSSISTSPTSGTGFEGSVKMSIDTITLTDVGVNYYPGDILTVLGGTGDRAIIEVLTTLSTPGAISSFRVISSGSYSVLPGVNSIPTTITSSAAPTEVGPIGVGATFSLTYKINSVSIEEGGEDYSIVSVRIIGGGGRGAFGTAIIVNGAVDSITITDQGSGFTEIPALTVDLPRFAIFTDGRRTDFTGNVEINTPAAFRGRDIREGLFLRGESSGALAQIVAHSGALDINGNELFDVDIKFGEFEEGEVISYGDVTKNIQITIFIESGIYEENLPIKVPQNTSIVGDEFRRCIIRPRSGISSSPWAFGKFRRDLTVGKTSGRSNTFNPTPAPGEWVGQDDDGDLITIASRLFGYHYLKDSSKPVVPKINNKGEYTSAATLLTLNRTFFQEEVIAWMNANIFNEVAPFTLDFKYNQSLCRRDVGLIIDALVFDLQQGEYNRTVAAGLKYAQSSSALIAITDQLDEYLAVMDHINELAQQIILNATIELTSQSTFLQIIDPAFQSENGSGDVLADLIGTLKFILANLENALNGDDSNINLPKNNDQLDMFLANDACRWTGITGQGHGGFMLVLDPTGQILAKSPYIEECSSFSKSTGKQTFAGGKFVDGFTGNLQFLHETTIPDTANGRITVSNLDRFPQLPSSFLVNDSVYRINYVRDFVYDPEGSTATFVLDETTPFALAAGAQNCTISVGNPAIITNTNHNLQGGATIKFKADEGGELPSPLMEDQEYYVNPFGITNNTFQITAISTSTTSIGTINGGSGSFTYQRVYEILMPGNRSMLSTAFTQINDLGYGLIAQNGGLVEAVSVFTYYCHISYYSINGGLIRSVAGSSAHGNYALVAQGADPLEVPTPTDLFEEISQSVACYAPTGEFANIAGDLSLFIWRYDYLPLNNSELEVIHNIDGINAVYRYTVTTVTTQGIAPDPTTGLPVARINLGAGVGLEDGLVRAIANNVKMTIRQGSQTILTGSLNTLSTRPSTGFKLRETIDTVYRVLELTEYNDTNGPYEVLISNSNPAIFKVLSTITAITGTSVCTTSKNHKLKIGDKFIPTSSSNGLTSGTTYYVIDVPEYNQFVLSTTQGGTTPVTLSNGTGLSIKGVKTHKLLENYTITFSSTISLPAPLTTETVYFVSSFGLTDTEFTVSTIRNGDRIATTSNGSGIHSYSMSGLTTTNLRENYDYIDLTLYQPGEYISATPTGTLVTSISIANPAVITLNSHGFVAGDVIKFTTSAGVSLPGGLSTNINYHVLASGLGLNVFQVSTIPDSTPASTTGTFTSGVRVGKVTGAAGSNSFAVIPVSEDTVNRISGSKFVWLGEEYIIVSYAGPSITNSDYARITLSRPLENSIISLASSYTIRAAVAIRSEGANGSLTVRISLTRVTSHDLLNVGTGSYADTNYPNEIYGPGVNPINPSNEAEERDVGRVFYVTTDQFGNFNVGPYFRVDQGTGTVTFASSIALSNLDGIGFKRGVPISEFSTDSAFSDNATDTVPTENATRIYVERRLGITHNGADVAEGQLIPATTGGFMALSGQLAMKGPMRLGNFKIENLANPTAPQDAVNLRSLTYNNFQDFTGNSVARNDIIVFTGNSNNSVNAKVTGDVTFTLDTGAENTVNIQINSDTIIDADVNSDAAIAQSKLAMNAATVRVNATGIVQADRGLASFNSAEFNATSGWIDLKNNGIGLGKIAQIAGSSVLGNSLAGAGNITAVAFSTIVNNGLAVKKSQFGQFGTTTGFLRRLTAGTSDGAFTTVEASSSYIGDADNGKLITRTGTPGLADGGDFGARDATLRRVVLSVEPNSLDNLATTNTVGMAGWTIGTGATGYTRVYGYQSRGGMLVFSGTGSNKTDYWNDSHNFRTQNGNFAAPITASSVQCTALTTGGNTTAGTITGRWTLTGTSPNESRLQATYSADLAEYYEGDQEYEVGTVLVFGGDKEVTLTNIKGDTRVAGVVSNTAAFVMYDACPGHKNLVALQGRVPCRVVGKIRKGDMLVTSGIAGVAVAAGNDVKVGTVVGKALVEYDSDHVGTIEIAVGRT